jgi:hypothetical protein
MRLESALDLGVVGVGVEPQLVLDADASDDEDAVLGLDLAPRLAREPAFARRDLTRLQRASERAR